MSILMFVEEEEAFGLLESLDMLEEEQTKPPVTPEEPTVPESK